MNWFILSFREWRRRPLRTSVTVAGVATAVAALFSMLAFLRGYRSGLDREMGRLGAHVLVAPKGCPFDAASLALHGASWPCYLKASHVEDVRATPGVAVAAPVFMAARFNPGAPQTVYVGIDTNYLALRPGWRIQGAFPQRENELLLGGQVARRQGWRVGQAVGLPGPAGAVATIAGVIEITGGSEDNFIFLRMEAAQRLFRHPGEITHVLVGLQDPNQMDRVVMQLRGCEAGLQMNIIPLAPLLHTILALLNSTRVLLGCVVVVSWLAAAAGISNALLLAVAERTREIGTMRALGAGRANIFRLFSLETLQVCLAGGGVGVLGAFAASRFLEAWLRDRLPFTPTEGFIHWDWALAALCLGCALGLGSLAGFLPAWHATRLSPMEAVRTQAGLL